ncbi:MAG: hypothetical protein ACP5KN_14740 [Armatimonadota bacterium]
MPTLGEEQINQKIAAYLKRNYGEELMECEILQDELNEEGDGRLVTKCEVRVGASRSLWQKTFTFRGGDIVDMSWRRLG